MKKKKVALRHGMNALVFGGKVTAADAPMLEQIKKAGFTSVEIPILERQSKSALQGLRRVLNNLGLRCTTVTIATTGADPTGGGHISEAALGWLSYTIDAAAILESEAHVGPYHSALGGRPKVSPTADEKRELMKRAAEILRLAASHAERRNVKLALEPLNRFECYLVNTVAELLELLRIIDHPNCGGMFDTFHAHIEERDPLAALTQLLQAKLLWRFHACANDRGVPDASQQVPLAEHFALLHRFGYTGYIVGEIFGSAIPTLAAATCVWRDLSGKPKDAIHNTGKAIRQAWSRVA